SVWTADAGYIPNGGTVFTSAVSVLSLSTFNFTHLLQSGNESYAVAYDPDGQQVAVANVELGDVWMYNATQYTLTHIFPTQTAPVAIAYDPSLHDLVVANELADSLSIVNSTTGGSERNVSLMGSPTAVAIGPTGLAYVCLVDQSLVAVINVASGTLVNHLTVGRNCTSLAIDPTSEILYATGFGPTNNVTLFNLTSDHYAPTWKVQSGYKEIAISGAGDYIVMAEDSWNTIWT
ncbi:MAG: hypothetical protein L3K08_05435, partial [Thermoplasmata archaeon]|nr:hypothetical protein [Thermoplasmata archaeon]